MLIIALMLAAFWVGYAVGWTKGQQAALRLLHDVTVRMRRGETLSGKKNAWEWTAKIDAA